MARKSKYYQRPDGLYEAIRKINGKRVAFRGKSCREVDRKILEYTAGEERGRLFREVAEEWWENHVDEIEPSTAHGYVKAYHEAMEIFGGQPIRGITPKDIELYFRTLAARKYGSKTIRNRRSVLNLIFKCAVVSGDLQTNPCDCIQQIKGTTPQVREPPTDEDIQTVISTYNQSPYGMVYLICLMTGCRRGEALALQHRDIDREKGVIHITKSVCYSTSHPVIKTTKTKHSIRDIILLDALADRLPSGNPDDYICAPGGLPPKSVFERGLKKYAEDVGISATLHQFRHGYATMLLDAGIDDKTAQVLLGHASIVTTRNIYTHITQSRIDTTAQKLNSFTSKFTAYTQDRQKT